MAPRMSKRKLQGPQIPIPSSQKARAAGGVALKIYTFFIPEYQNLEANVENALIISEISKQKCENPNLPWSAKKKKMIS